MHSTVCNKRSTYICSCPSSVSGSALTGEEFSRKTSDISMGVRPADAAIDHSNWVRELIPLK